MYREWGRVQNAHTLYRKSQEIRLLKDFSFKEKQPPAPEKSAGSINLPLG